MHSPLRKSLFAICLLCLIAGCTSCGGGGATTAAPPARPAFDSARAMASIQAQCAFGFRVPGSTAHDQCRAYLQTELAKYADKVVSQDFNSATDLSNGTQYPFTNIIGVFAATAAGDPLVMLSHWDSRPIADQDPVIANRTKPVMAANDGASGVAVLLEVARALKAQPPTRPILILFVDAEDSGKDGSPSPYEGFCVGTKYYVDHLPADLPKPKAGILLDMVGSLHNFSLEMEQYSLQYNAALVNAVWAAAETQHHAAFKRVGGAAIIDDHMPLNDAGIKSIDIIHWHPPEWHTVSDTPENCSADSLYQVGDTLLQYLYGG